MRKLIVAFCLLLPTYGWAQDVSASQVETRLSDLDKLKNGVSLNPNAGFDNRQSRLYGSIYFDSSWHTGGLTLRGHQKPLKNLPLRYDLFNQQLEIRHQDEIKLASAYELAGFYFVDGSGIRREFTVLKTEEGNTIFELLAEGKYCLLRKHEVIQMEPNYVEQFDVGSRDIRLIPQRSFYLQTPEGLIEAKKIKKKMHNPALKQFMRQEQLSLQRLHDLQKIAAFLNEENP
jgi:hypothetical protein